MECCSDGLQKWIDIVTDTAVYARALDGYTDSEKISYNVYLFKTYYENDGVDECEMDLVVYNPYLKVSYVVFDVMSFEHRIGKCKHLISLHKVIAENVVCHHLQLPFGNHRCSAYSVKRQTSLFSALVRACTNGIVALIAYGFLRTASVPFLGVESVAAFAYQQLPPHGCPRSFARFSSDVSNFASNSFAFHNCLHPFKIFYRYNRLVSALNCYHINLTVVFNLLLREKIGHIFLAVSDDTAVKRVFQHVGYYGFIPPAFTHCGFVTSAFKLVLYLRHSVTCDIHLINQLYRFRLLGVDIKIYLLFVVRQGLLNTVVAKNIAVSVVSIMMSNNEIGTIQPIKELVTIAHKNGSIFHTDAVQSVGHIPIDVKNLGVDILSASAHKFNGPKGIGFLYIKRGTSIISLLNGGLQEHGYRAGTENIASIVGMATALKKNCAKLEENKKAILKLENTLLNVLNEKRVSFVHNGIGERVPGNLSLSFPGFEGETVLHRLDLMGIQVSTGSACDSVNTQISHVLRAIQVDETVALGTIRISFGKDNTTDDAEKIALAIYKIIQKQ